MVMVGWTQHQWLFSQPTCCMLPSSNIALPTSPKQLRALGVHKFWLIVCVSGVPDPTTPHTVTG